MNYNEGTDNSMLDEVTEFKEMLRRETIQEYIKHQLADPINNKHDFIERYVENKEDLPSEILEYFESVIKDEDSLLYNSVLDYISDMGISVDINTDSLTEEVKDEIYNYYIFFIQRRYENIVDAIVNYTLLNKRELLEEMAAYIDLDSLSEKNISHYKKTAIKSQYKDIFDLLTSITQIIEYFFDVVKSMQELITYITAGEESEYTNKFIQEQFDQGYINFEQMYAISEYVNVYDQHPNSIKADVIDRLSAIITKRED